MQEPREKGRGVPAKPGPHRATTRGDRRLSQRSVPTWPVLQQEGSWRPQARAFGAHGPGLFAELLGKRWRSADQQRGGTKVNPGHVRRGWQAEPARCQTCVRPHRRLHCAGWPICPHVGLSCFLSHAAPSPRALSVSVRWSGCRDLVPGTMPAVGCWFRTAPAACGGEGQAGCGATLDTWRKGTGRGREAARGLRVEAGPAAATGRVGVLPPPAPVCYS